ncbi:MAG: ATP-binding protein [Thermodesulfobacteriota bacterium]|nr:ATP-binding protein [Thermodesulfobacteriota bacterium]
MAVLSVAATLLALFVGLVVDRIFARYVFQRNSDEKKIKHLNSVLLAIRNVNQLIVGEKDLDRLLQGACENLTKTRGYYNAWIALLDKSGGLLKAVESGLGEKFSLLVEQLKRGMLTKCGQEALSRPGVVVTEDPFSECADCPLPEEYGDRGAMTVRMEHEEKVYGFLSVSIPKDFAMDEEERSLLREVAMDIALALHNIESEEKRKQAEQALRESEVQKKVILDSSIDMIMLVDTQMRMVWANKKAAEVVNKEPEDLRGHTCYNFFQDTGKPCSGCPLEKAMETGKIEHATMYHPAMDTVGESYWDNYAVPLKDDSGRITGAIEIARDVTDRKQAEKALKQAKEAAEFANKSKSEFLSTMSHEIRTPLNGILGMLQLLQFITVDAPQKEYIDLALASGKSLLTVINDILDFSRIEAGKLKIVDKDFNLSEILQTIIGSFRLQAGEKGIRLHYDIDDGVPDFLVGDGGRIRQILFNLVGNSMKYTEHGEVYIQVCLMGRKDGSEPLRLFFSVSDTGKGIPEGMFKYIFEPFTQVDGSYTRKYQGAGLGLSIVKRLVERMGGSAAVESRVGVGTTVYFSVRVNSPGSMMEVWEGISGRRQEDASLTGGAEQPEFSLERWQTISGIPQGDVPFSPFKILVAEDNPANRILAVKLLEVLGHTAIAAEDGKEAVKALEKERFDLVLMDVQMPVVGGIEATKIIRKSTSGKFDPKIPIIALTAHAMEGDRERFLGAGMDDYIAKPVEVRELVAGINRVMSSRTGTEVTKSA